VDGIRRDQPPVGRDRHLGEELRVPVQPEVRQQVCLVADGDEGTTGHDGPSAEVRPADPVSTGVACAVVRS
jgi:hypothetical protein